MSPDIEQSRRTALLPGRSDRSASREVDCRRRFSGAGLQRAGVHFFHADDDGDSDEARVRRPPQAGACTCRIASGPRAGQRCRRRKAPCQEQRDSSRTCAPTCRVSACTRQCAAAVMIAKRWIDCAATSPARLADCAGPEVRPLVRHKQSTGQFVSGLGAGQRARADECRRTGGVDAQDPLARRHHVATLSCPRSSAAGRLTIPIHHCSGSPARRAAGVGCVRVVAGPMEAARRRGVTRRQHPGRRFLAGLSTNGSPPASKDRFKRIGRRVLPCSG